MSYKDKANKLPDLPVYLYTRESVLWYYFTHKGRVYRGTTKTDDPRQARKVAAERFFDVEQGRINGKTLKLRKASEKFLAFKAARVSPKTITTYTGQIKYLVEKFGDRDIASFTRKDFNDYQAWRYEYYRVNEKKQTPRYMRNGRTLRGRKFKEVGNALLNREIGLLRNILRFCQHELGMMPGVEIPRWRDLPERIRDVILDHTEFDKLRRYFAKHSPYHWKIISFCNYTGLRYPSEVNNLLWKDVDLKRSIVVIRNRKSKKTNPQNMPVPLVRRAAEILESLKNREGIKAAPEDYVFVDDNCRRILNIGKYFKQAQIACGVKHIVTMYSLRHRFASQMIKRGDIPLMMIARALGHVDTTMLQRRYGHLLIKDVVKAFRDSEARLDAQERKE